MNIVLRYITDTIALLHCIDLKKLKSMSRVNIWEADKNILTDIVIVRIRVLWPVKARARNSTIIHNF